MDNNQQPQTSPVQQQAEARQYFYPIEEQKDPVITKEQLSAYGNKFQYYAMKAWPTVTNLINFFFYHIKRTIGGIISIGKEEMMNK